MKNHNILVNILQMFSKIVVFTQSALSELQEKALVILIIKKGVSHLSKVSNLRKLA